MGRWNRQKLGVYGRSATPYATGTEPLLRFGPVLLRGLRPCSLTLRCHPLGPSAPQPSYAADPGGGHVHVAPLRFDPAAINPQASERPIASECKIVGLRKMGGFPRRYERVAAWTIRQHFQEAQPTCYCWILARAYISRRVGADGGAACAAVAHCRCGQPCRVPSESNPRRRAA
jgi:hypothetical protein